MASIRTAHRKARALLHVVRCGVRIGQGQQGQLVMRTAALQSRKQHLPRHRCDGLARGFPLR